MFFSRAVVALVFLWRTMLSPEATPTFAPAPAAAAKDSVEEPCFAVASTVRSFAYAFFFSEAEEISAAVVRFNVSTFVDTPRETPPAAAAPTEGVPVKEPRFV